MFISKEMIKDIGYESVEEFILDQDRSHKIRINKFTAEGVDFDYDLDSGVTDDGKRYFSKSEVAMEIFEEIETALNLTKCYGDSGIYYEHDLEAYIAEIKKKYTEGQT